MSFKSHGCKFYFVVLCASVLAASCASSRAAGPEAQDMELSSQMTDTFLGDFNPIIIKSTMALIKGGREMKPKELSRTYLIPRQNLVEVHFRDMVNQICIILDKSERDKLTNAANAFLEQYEQRTLHRGKVSSKTAYYNSRCPLYFGLTGSSIGTDSCDYFTNSEIFQNKAYFLINCRPSRCDTGSGFTPNVRLYFSPSQLKDFIEILDQDYLNAQVQDLREKAYTY